MRPVKQAPRTLFGKIWRRHRVGRLRDGRDVIHFDRHLLHDLTSPQAFSALEAAGRPVRSPELCLAVADHLAPTTDGEGAPGAAAMLAALRDAALRHGILHLGAGHPAQGVVHVTAAELGLALPGMAVACGDSHTPTLGALGCLALGVGTSQVEQLLASQCLALTRPRTLRVELTGGPIVDGKDLALAVVRALGVKGARGAVVEFTGPVVAALPMDGRFTLCNLAVEAGARTALIAPDAVTRAWLAETPVVQRWPAALRGLQRLATDPGATFDASLVLRLGDVGGLVTWGVRPDQSLRPDEPLPDPDAEFDSSERQAMAKALAYMGLRPGQVLQGVPIDLVFIGSCANGRLSDLMAAADVVRGRHVAPRVRALVAPGSAAVKWEAERLGLDRVFRAAGFEWRSPGCSLCIGMNGDSAAPGQRCVSTANRNFEGRQGPGVRTHLASPVLAAAAAVRGEITTLERLDHP